MTREEREQALEWFKNRPVTMSGAKKMYDLAISALEQPEPCEYYAICRHGRDEEKLRARSKFCEYCNEDFDGYVKPIEKNCHAFIRFGMNGWELDMKANGWHGSAKIRYCPMCGRDLFVNCGARMTKEDV